MKIVNSMFGRNLGGLEQVFVDYSEALAARGNEVVNFIAPQAGVAAQLEALNLSCEAFNNFNHYDLLAAWRIRRRLKELRPDAIIAHGNRAINLLRIAARGVAPLIAVNHSINVKRTVGSDYAVAINGDMRERLIAAGQRPETIFKVFNMIRTPASLPPPREPRNPPVIAAMGRFVAKKDFRVFLDALAMLKNQGVAFRAVLAGDGELATELKAQSVSLGLGGILEFPGWIQDKAAFFDSIDFFCFTSNHDVCPVVLLEAFLYAKSVLLTDCPGPREISDDGNDSLLFPIGDAAALAGQIKALLANPGHAKALGAAARRKILEHHTMEKTGELLEEIVKKVSSASAIPATSTLRPST